MASVKVGDLTLGGGHPLFFIGGPDVIEGEAHALRHAKAIAEICRGLGVPFIYKSSYDKANRTSGSSFRGPGLKKGLAILKKVRTAAEVPVLTDVHSPDEARAAAKAVDVLQIPAFLCRQTDLIVAAAKTGRALHIKKGQFLAPWDMRNVLAKATSTGNHRVMLAERGTTFGYNALVVDMRSIAILKSFGHPVVMDAGHSVQSPSAGQGGTVSGVDFNGAFTNRTVDGVYHWMKGPAVGPAIDACGLVVGPVQHPLVMVLVRWSGQTGPVVGLALCRSGRLPSRCRSNTPEHGFRDGRSVRFQSSCCLPQLTSDHRPAAALTACP